MFQKIAINLFMLILLAVVSPAMTQGSTGIQGYILIVPRDETRRPYVLEFNNITEAFGVVFPESVRVSLITSRNFTFWGGRFNIVPHVQSGGYRLDGLQASGAGQTSSSIEAIDEFYPEIAEAIKNDLEDVLDLATAGISDPLPVRAEDEMFVISPGGTFAFTPLTAADNACNSTHIKSVIAFDFITEAVANNDQPQVSFQLSTLSSIDINPAQDSPSTISFGIPSFQETIPFSAITNTSGPSGDKLSIKLFISPFLNQGDDEIIYRMRTWDRFAQVSTRTYTSLYQLISRVGSNIYPASATEVGQLPINNFIKVEMATANCRNFQVNDLLLPIDDQPVNYYRAGEVGGTSAGTIYSQTLQENSETLRLAEVSDDGQSICIDLPSGSPIEFEKVCLDGWRVKQVQQGN